MRKLRLYCSVAVILCLFLSTGLTGCGKSEVANTGGEEQIVVKIGVAQPLTGPSSNDGVMSRDGAALALEHMAVNPELSKYKIELIEGDDKSDPKDATSIANNWSGDESMIAVIGNYNSTCTLAAGTVLSKAGIPQISTGSSSPTITGFSPYLFRTQPTDVLVGKNIVDWATSLGYKKAAIVYENSDFGKGLDDIYKNTWGGEIVDEESYIPGSTTDFTPILTKIKKSGAECVLMGSLYNEAALMGKQAKQVGLDCVFFGDTSQQTNALLELGGKNVENWHVIGALSTESKDANISKFVSDFNTKYGHLPNSFAAQAYDAMGLILEGLSQNGPDREKIKDYLYNVKDYPGVTGKLTFNQGDVQKTLFRFVVKDGAFVEVEK